MLANIRDWLGFGAAGQAEGHGQSHAADGHGHTHGVIDASISSSERGIWAIKWSFVILGVTSVLQLAVVIISGSVALLADTIHNIGDATTAIPLWVAFVLARRKPTRTFSYGLGRVEDIAGLLIILIILFSAIVAAYEAIDRLIHPHIVNNLPTVALAGIIGFIGNEAVAVFRIRVGRAMNSAALIADGYHARTDGFTSLAVVLGAAGVWFGFPLADPIVGLLITIAIFGIVWQSAKAVITRSLDGVAPNVLDEIQHAAEHVPGVRRVVDARARWLGHVMRAEVTVAVDPALSVEGANAIASKLKGQLHAHMPALESVSVQFDGAAPEMPALAHGHHAPSPFQVRSDLAEGVVAIVDTPDGERMRLTTTRRAGGLSATVRIARPGGVEILNLAQMPHDPGTFQSGAAPAEPHEFSAELVLGDGRREAKLAFSMTEPEHHDY